MERKYLSAVALKREPEEEYLRQLPAVRWLAKGGRLRFSSDVAFLVGENGTGKSTLLEAVAVACGFNPEGGSKNFSFSTRETHSSLHRCISVVRQSFPKDGYFLRAESFYNVASNLDDLDGYPALSPKLLNSYGGVSLHKQSHGESFMALVEHRFGGRGLYLLDEPEAALSPRKQLELLARIDLLVQRDSQFLIATHSPMLMAFPGAQVFQLSELGIEEVPYQETDHFQLMRAFLNCPDRLLHLLR